MVVEVRIFRQVADVPAHGHRVHGLSQDPGGSRRRPNQVHQQLECCRFAGPIRTEEPEYFTRFHSQAQTVESPDRTLAPEARIEIFGQVLNLDRGHKA